MWSDGSEGDGGEGDGGDGDGGAYIVFEIVCYVDVYVASSLFVFSFWDQLEPLVHHPKLHHRLRWNLCEKSVKSHMVDSVVECAITTMMKFNSGMVYHCSVAHVPTRPKRVAGTNRS